MGTFVIKDKNLKPENIKKGVTILKTTGTLDASGGGSINLQEKTVDSSTSNQTVTPDTSYDGLSKVTVNKYTLDTKTVDPSTSSQTVNSSADGLSSVTVTAVTSSIDSNIQAGNIKKDVVILGVTGILESGSTINNQSKTVDSSTVSQSVTYDSSYTGLGTVTINPYTLDSKTVDPSTSQQTVNSSADGLSSVTVNAVDASIDANIQAGNIKDGVTILGVTGTYSGGGGGNDWILEAKLGNITDLSGYSLPNVTHDYQYGYLFSNTAITSTPDLSSITSITNQSGCIGMFQNCTSLTSVNLCNLTTVNGRSAMSSMFSGCTNLTTVDLSSLTSYSGTNAVNSMFNNCTNLTTLRCHPNLFTSNNTSSTIAYQLGHIVNLTFTAMSESNNQILLSKEPYLSADSVYSVLTHLNTSIGSTCSFYSGGLTVMDYQDGRIQAAYDAAVAAGWTINNLTITSYSRYTTLTKITTNNDTIPLDFGTPSIKTSFGIDIEFLSYPSNYVDFISASTEGNPDYVAIAKSGVAGRIYAEWGDYVANNYITYDGNSNLRFSNVVIGCDSSGCMGYYFNDGIASSSNVNPNPVSGVTTSANLTIGVSTVSMDIYGISMYTDYDFVSSHTGTLVYNFVPTLDNFTGKYGLYETVNDVFYPCANGNMTGTV